MSETSTPKSEREEKLPKPDDLAELAEKRKREILVDLRGLVNHPGWVYIRSVLMSQSEQRYITIGRMQPFKVEDFLAQIALRAEAHMVEDLCGYPEFLIEALEFELGDDVNEEEDEDE